MQFLVTLGMTNWTSAELTVMGKAGYVPSEELPIELQRSLYLEPLFGPYAGEVLLYVRTFKETISWHNGNFTSMVSGNITAGEHSSLIAFGLYAALNDEGITVPRAFLEKFLHEELKAYLPTKGAAPSALKTLTGILFAVANQASPIADKATEAAARVHDRMLDH